MRDFLAAIENNPEVMTTIVMPSGEGVSVSLKLAPAAMPNGPP